MRRLRSCCSISAYSFPADVSAVLDVQESFNRRNMECRLLSRTVMKISPFVCLLLLLAISEPAAAQQRRNDHNTQLVYACGSKGLSADFVNRNCVDWRGRETNQLNHSPMREQNSNPLTVWCSRLGKVPKFAEFRRASRYSMAT